MNVSSYPNPLYRCSRCNKDLWNRRKRLKNPNKAPNVNKVIGEIYCDKCYNGEGEIQNDLQPNNTF